MFNTIQEELKKIEQRKNIKILHCAEAGSRAWGFASTDSDYDVRFIYVRPINEYLKLEKARDVIELPINDRLDINGWDLKKALVLLHSSNSALLEWFSSTIIYRHTVFTDEFRKMMPRYFINTTGVYHYLGMAKRNYKEYLLNDMVKCKKYFYVLRAILACRWIIHNKTIPPILFNDLVKSELPHELNNEVFKLLDLKIHSPEIKFVPKIETLNTYIEQEFDKIQKEICNLYEEQHNGYKELDKFFIKYITVNN